MAKIINLLIFLIFFSLNFIKIQLVNYLTFELHKVDDCIRAVYFSNELIFNYKPENLSMCSSKINRLYPKYFVLNQEYNFGTQIKIIFQDTDHHDGYFDISIHFNEYIIRVKDQVFWKCLDCGGPNKDYVYDNDRINFYPGKGDKKKYEKNYTFIFQIDDDEEFKKGRFEVNDDYYSFTNQKIFYRELYYLDNELELINFNTTNNFFIKDNATLPIDINNYKFEIEFINNDFKGNLSALDLSGNEIILGDGYQFKTNNNKGLSYKLNEDEIRNRAVNISIRLTAYNFPDLNDGRSRIVAKTTEFHFIITLYDDFTELPESTGYESTEPSIEKSSEESTEKSSEKSAEISSEESTEKNSKENTKNIDNILPNSSEINLLCLDQYISYDGEKDIYFYLCPNYNTNEIEKNIDEIINRTDTNKTYVIKASDYTAQISHINNTEPNYNNNSDVFYPSTYANFSECEKILREYYTILPSRKLTFIQIQINNTIDEALVNQIEYQVYDDQNKQLNLSLCYDKNMTIFYSFKNDTKDKIDLINNFKDKGIDILDINDPFFNDICIPYSESGKDLTLNDRIEEKYKNYQFCEKNCELNEILYEDKMISCNCTIKNNINAKDINFNIENNKTKKNMNYKIIKCLNAFSSLKDNIFNIGFLIFLFLMILNIIFLILFCCLKVKPFEKYMKKEMTKYGYVDKADEDNMFCHHYVNKLDKLIGKLNLMKNSIINKKINSPPPKHKFHFENETEKSIRKKLIKVKEKDKDKKNKNLEKEIELLKKRMDKTKKSKFAKDKNIKLNKKNSREKLNDKANKTKDTNTISLISLRTKDGQSNNEKEEENKFNVNLIYINTKDLKKKVYIPNESEHILNIYEYKEALKYDKRSFCSIYYIFLISKQVIMHAFLYKSPIEPFPARLSLLKFILGCDLAVNAFFYTDDKVSERYHSIKNDFIFAFTNNLLAIFVAILIGYIFLLLFANLNNSTNEIRKIFRNEEKKIKKDNNYKVSVKRKKEIILEVKSIIKKFKIKITIFYVLEFLIMILFWFYVTIFCYIYNKTIISWLINTLVTIIIRILLDLFMNLLFTIFYKLSISIKSSCLFKGMICIYCVN